jgi:hypothetical protein
MTTPDRTEDLLRRMLDRRAGAPPPGWLLPGVAEAVRQTGQVRGGRAWGGLLGTRRAGRLALVAAAVILLLAVAAGVLVAAGLILPQPAPRLPAVVVLPSPSASPSQATSEETASPRDPPIDEPQPTATSTPPAFGHDTIAVVTTAGDGLRVRSKPSVGKDSEKLSPLLKQDSRMLVVRGPVSADGYDWYEVQADNDLFGWVAAGKDGEAWIAPTEPACTDDLDESALRIVTPIDWLVCYRDTPVAVTADAWEIDCCDTGTYEAACEYTGGDVPCVARPRWLFDPRGFALPGAGVGTPELFAAARGSVARRLDAMPGVAAMTLTLSRDAAEARDCRIVDRRGRDLISRDEAITMCRMTWVIRDVAWDPAFRDLDPGTLARVVAPQLPMHTEPGGPPNGLRLAAGADALVVAGPLPYDTGVSWYEVLSADGTATGFVPFTEEGGRPALEAIVPSCPLPTDWLAVENLPPVVRLACFGDRPMTLTMRVDDREPANAVEGLCDLYRATTTAPRPCLAAPAWLADYSGVFGTDPSRGGNGVELRFDPGKVRRDWIPASPQVMQVTGSFANAVADDCEAVDPRDDDYLFDSDNVAPAYCRTQFVATEIVPLPSPSPR